MFATAHQIVSPSVSSVMKLKLILNPVTNSAGAPTFSRCKRTFSFTFAGPKTLNEILRKDLVQNKSSNEISDIWYTYHEGKDNVHGIVLDGKSAKPLLSRAAASPFFIQPIFRDDGYFMLMSQFMKPSHFIMAYLEDYKMDPSSAQPLLSFSVFDDYAENKDLTLVRADILNNGINDEEGLKVVRSVLEQYRRDEEYAKVKIFNSKPESFDIDDFIAQQSNKWRQNSDAGGGTSKTTVDVES